MTPFELTVLMGVYGIWGYLTESRLLTVTAALFGLTALVTLVGMLLS